jgi:type III restriction enzyme
MDQCLVCKGGTNHGLLMFREMADMACERMIQAIVVSAGQEQRRLAILDPYNPSGSTMHVNFNTSKTLRWETDSRRCHVNWGNCDSTWEQEFCRVLLLQLLVLQDREQPRINGCGISTGARDGRHSHWNSPKPNL